MLWDLKRIRNEDVLFATCLADGAMSRRFHIGDREAAARFSMEHGAIEAMQSAPPPWGIHDPCRTVESHGKCAREAVPGTNAHILRCKEAGYRPDEEFSAYEAYCGSSLAHARHNCLGPVNASEYRLPWELTLPRQYVFCTVGI